MNYTNLIQTLVATIIGGLIVVGTNWINANREKRKAIQDWYERNYILEGIDVLAVYYQMLSFHMLNKVNHNSLHMGEIGNVPVEALVKVRVLLKTLAPFTIIIIAHEYLTRNESSHEILEAAHVLQGVVEILLDYRPKLVKIVSTKVHSKNYITDTSSVEEKLDNLSAKLVKLENEWKERLRKEEAEDYYQREMQGALTKEEVLQEEFEEERGINGDDY